MTHCSVVCIGECMVELMASDQPDQLKKGFAGDTFNTAYYLKHILGTGECVSYMTAVGKDVLSQELVQTLENAGLDTQYIRQMDDRTVGLYLVENDVHGERYFTYWRSQSAAKSLFQGQEGYRLLASLESFSTVYLSGISLAILPPNDRALLIDTLKEQGRQVIFDPNYRPALWESKRDALASFQALAKTGAIVMTTLEDEEALQDLNSADTVTAFWLAQGAGDVIVKMGAKGCFIASEKTLVPALSGITPIDTTGAGDSFNGGYIAGLLQGASPKEAALKAHTIAAQVIQQRGAIIPSDLFTD
ncbi:2-dehydro-3-deoxygluconokinase [Marinomonas spartinae]|uniref:sugar kinase n=1 Tax=Marinomonas spartinae TaxID=1792290 RepID=UPI000808CB22|nr:sugar kinase [Marinomonas spartinae]SBS24724.1 2-dehydro-3-deoxygluconokinase [Marinomonas spartinae]